MEKKSSSGLFYFSLYSIFVFFFVYGSLDGIIIDNYFVIFLIFLVLFSMFFKVYFKNTSFFKNNSFKRIYFRRLYINAAFVVVTTILSFKESHGSLIDKILVYLILYYALFNMGYSYGFSRRLDDLYKKAYFSYQNTRLYKLSIYFKTADQNLKGYDISSEIKNIELENMLDFEFKNQFILNKARYKVLEISLTMVSIMLSIINTIHFFINY